MAEAHPVALLDDHVTLAGAGAEVSLPNTAMRNRSVAARRVLARAAGIGLDEVLEAARKGDTRKIRRPVDPALLAGLAQTIALQDEQPSDRADALALYALIRTGRGARSLPGAHQALHAQLVYAWQGPGNARQLLGAYHRIPAAARESLEIDLANPHAGGLDEEETWLARFGALFPSPPPVLAAAPERAPFDRLAGSAGHPAETAGERVSVVVTAYRPGEGLLTAVRSIAAQSWPDLEIIVVDDASPPEHDAILAAAEDLDPRVRLIRLPGNGGTYAARNAGLAAARGDFVTFQDSDDWSHPRRIELQLAPLLAGPAVVASTSEGISVTDHLVMTRPGIRRGRVNVSSLLFRREAVLRRIGWFDAVRKAADSEYLERIQAAFGPGSVVRVAKPLALIRLTEGSLSRSEIRAYWMHPARTAYMSAYRCWHAGVRPLHRERAGTDRPFVAPAHLSGLSPARRYDVVVAADWRFLTGTQRSALAEIRALRAAGHSVAILHLESLRSVHRQRRSLSPGVQRLINTGRLDQVLETEDVDAGLLLVRQPEVLQFAPEDGCRIRPRRVVLVADRAPARRDGSDRRYTVPAASAAAVRLFGAAPLWCPQDAAVRNLIAGAEMTDFDLPYVAEPLDVARPMPAPLGPAVVGTDLCDAGEWPGDLAEALAVPRRFSDADVRLRLPESPLRPAGLPASWLVYEPADLDPRTFTAQIDFYLHFPAEQSAEMLSRPALEAAATGCVVLVPGRLADAFGDAAVPCAPADAPAVVRRFQSDPRRYAAQSARARAAVARDHRPEALTERIGALLHVGAPAPAQRGRNGAGTNPVTPGAGLS
ncbi:glycosyltransferase family A protein [Actinoplanes sp. NEAU-A12]|uniref:Glycosyltransferase family A protein n=1 Tax=Actinoplanes sandaracinus TaxID=3045177 RepID=A0ABT6WD74_9ACTN|nr:glycosyltransferase family A protein [Actinoplanes sandaracinus]MDI6097653.1 glycosyltransferase family A protein [Actinoplanes sandaracinus]